jgi:hypothetical protein
MIVPQFWAESRVQHRADGRQVTVRRFGWSDESQADAQAQADARARQALERIIAGEKLPRRDLKRPYNGSEGVPIREEIVERHGDTVLTRNSYGAVCLNTPDVLFADIDFEGEPSLRLTWTVIGLLLCGSVALGVLIHPGLACAAALLSLFGGYAVAVGMYRTWIGLAGGEEQIARRRIARFLNRHPDWHLRLYRTPAGLRLLAMHRPFDPAEAAVAECFRTLGTDPIYVRMCQRQRCFRARVSPKPWRIGIAEHLKPRPGIWPISPERLPERQAWVAAYEQAARRYAACRFLESLGSLVTHPKAAEVQRLHDELCQANRALELA